MARLDPTPYELPEVDHAQLSRDRVPIDEWPDMQAMKALSDASNALPEGEIVGAILRFPVADGYAIYRVTKERPLTLQHVLFGDEWQIHPALLRGLTKADVLHQVRQARALDRLFNRTEEDTDGR